jgi:hypothetical protein
MRPVTLSRAANTAVSLLIFPAWAAAAGWPTADAANTSKARRTLAARTSGNFKYRITPHIL